MLPTGHLDKEFTARLRRDPEGWTDHGRCFWECGQRSTRIADREVHHLPSCGTGAMLSGQ